MNEFKNENVVSLAQLCCTPDKKCETCTPEWRRSVIIDGNKIVWFPVQRITNEELKVMADSQGGLVINQETGVWWIDEEMIKLLNPLQTEQIGKSCDEIRIRASELAVDYDAKNAEDKVAECDQL